MKSPYLVSSILNGIWAIDPVKAEGFYPLVFSLLTGKQVSFETKERTSAQMGSFVSNGVGNSNEKRVAILSYKDVVIKYDQECGPEGTESFSNRIRNAANDDSIAAIILDIDTPGGDGGACMLPSQSIQDARKIKPVIAYVGNGMCASAGYFIASNANEIYATFQTDEIGSIGTYVTLLDYKSYYASKGLPVHEIYASKSSNKNRLFKEALEGTEEKYDQVRKEYIDPFNQVFLDTVMQNRGIEADSEALTGKLYYAKEALEMGLIDGLKSFNEVIDHAFELAETYVPTNTGNNSKTNNSNNMFGKNKFKALSTFAEAAEEERTVEMLDAVNQELQANGINGFLMEATEGRSSAADVNAAIASANDQVNTATINHNTAKDEVTRLTGELSTANARITELESNSAGPSRQSANADDLDGDESPEAIMAAMEHNKRADEQYY